ncbi:hypothetical protein QBC47DRAFT_366882 [Echria macrotheca]|uniref:BTB domain-containing protein n=1 Tax=Echria macrotheca TaxID=438768 RepID=A0AAJ0BN82_9PEZI|nr:hypothetical protein QBC47DRAFT_366882 [Echria macrotheca]
MSFGLPTPTWEEFASSPPFTIVVGANKKKFYMHSALLASLSTPLSRLVNNDNFKESHEAEATWGDVDEETFAYFVQYAYTFDYHVPGPPSKGGGFWGGSVGSSFGPIAIAPEKSTNTIIGTPAVTSDTATGRPTGSLFGSPVPTPATASTPAGRGLHFQFGKNPEPSITSAPTQKGSEALRAKLASEFKSPPVFGGPRRLVAQAVRPLSTTIQNSTSVKILNPLLAHARLFILADYYDIAALADISYKRMGQALLDHYSDPKAFEHAWQMEHVVELLAYCWSDDRPAKLRESMILYVACEMEVLWDNEGFRKLVENSGELAMDLLAMMAQRLKSS